MSKPHTLKCWPMFFAAIANGTKTFDVRRRDRDFVVGDTLALREFDPVGAEGKYTGRVIFARIGYILTGEAWGVVAGFVVAYKLATDAWVPK